MTKAKEESERIRKKYAPRGSRSQVRQGFLVDEENAEWLKHQPNKGRYLNNLIRADREKHEAGT